MFLSAGVRLGTSLSGARARGRVNVALTAEDCLSPFSGEQITSISSKQRLQFHRKPSKAPDVGEALFARAHRRLRLTAKSISLPSNAVKGRSRELTGEQGTPLPKEGKKPKRKSREVKRLPRGKRNAYHGLLFPTQRFAFLLRYGKSTTGEKKKFGAFDTGGFVTADNHTQSTLAILRAKHTAFGSP